MRRLVLTVAAVLAGVLFMPPAAHAARCTRAAADQAARTQLLPYADPHDEGFFDEFGGVEELGYAVGSKTCRDLTDDGEREMIVHLQCCTGGSPSPWGIFTREPSGAWKLAYARAVDTVFRLQFRDRAVR